MDKGNVVNPVDDAIRGFLVAEEALIRCTEMLRAEGVSGFDIADALLLRFHTVFRPEQTTDATVLRQFMERSIVLLDDTIKEMEALREIYTEELADL